MLNEELKQLDHEIRRHLAMAELSSGIVRADHIQALLKLLSLRRRIGGMAICKKSRLEDRTGLHQVHLQRKKKAY